MNTTTTAPLFVWDNDYKNTEQVRPYLAAFNALYPELDRGDGLAYNDSFKGRIPGLAGSQNEDTGIYLLQTLRELDQIAAKVQAFIDAGGYPLTERVPAPTERGTLARTGWYMGGTGWNTRQVAKVRVHDGMVQFKEPRQRSWRTFYDGPDRYLFMPEGA